MYNSNKYTSNILLEFSLITKFLKYNTTQRQVFISIEFQEQNSHEN